MGRGPTLLHENGLSCPCRALGSVVVHWYREYPDLVTERPSLRGGSMPLARVPDIPWTPRWSSRRRGFVCPRYLFAGMIGMNG